MNGIAIANEKRAALERAQFRCEGSPKYPACRAKDGQAHPETDKPVRLSVFHTRPGDVTSLRCMCERCFLSFDFAEHKTIGWRERRGAQPNLELFPIDPKGE